jgi:Domain of unknown function (DUF5666)
MNKKLKHRIPALLLAAIALTGISCGGGNQLAGGGIGGTGITTGTVTGFGSIFVNGVEFGTAGATRTVDGTESVSNGSDDDTVLGQGMVVTVTGSENADGVTGTARSVSYDEVVEGPVMQTPVENVDMTAKNFSVFDLNVVANRNTTVYVNTDYQSLAQDRMVELSGFFDAAGNLQATRIADHGVIGPASVVQLKGNVSQFNGVDTFTLGSVTIGFDGNTVFTNLPGGVMNGQYVEVAGSLAAADMIHATRIELQQATTLTGEVSLEGIVTVFHGTGDFLVNGQQVNASAATFVPAQLENTLSVNQRVEVEGEINAGVLVATQIEQRGGNVELSGRVILTSPVAGNLQVEIVSGQPLITISVDNRTQMEDEQYHQGALTLADINAGDEVAVEGYTGGAGSVIARQLERVALEKYELKGPVDAASGNALSGSITILGVAMQTADTTVFEDAASQPYPNGGDDFFSQVAPGELVKVEDDVPVDGIADAVEFKQ